MVSLLIITRAATRIKGRSKLTKGHVAGTNRQVKGRDHTAIAIRCMSPRLAIATLLCLNGPSPCPSPRNRRVKYLDACSPVLRAAGVERGAFGVDVLTMYTLLAGAVSTLWMCCD